MHSVHHICNDVKRRVYSYLTVGFHNKLDGQINNPLLMCNKDYIYRNAHHYNSKHFEYLLSTSWFDVNHTNSNNESILDHVVSQNKIDLLILLLKNEHVDPNVTGNKAMMIASIRGYDRVMDLLLKDGRADPCINNDECLLKATDRSHIGIVGLLLKDGRADPSVNQNEALTNAIRCNNMSILSLLLRDDRVDPSVNQNEIIRHVALLGRLDMIQILLKDRRINPYDQNIHQNTRRNAMITASSRGFIKIVSLFLKNEHINPECLSNSIAYAIRGKHFDVANLLIDDFHSDPVLYLRIAMHTAASMGCIEILDRLLKDPRHNPFAENNNGILNTAVTNNQIESVNLLLEDERVKPENNSNWVLWKASKLGYFDIVKRLLEHPNVDPSACRNRAVIIASKYGHIDVVNLLLTNSDVDPSDRSNEALYFASQAGYVEVVKRLLKDNRVDPVSDNNRAVWIASVCGHDDVVTILLEKGCTIP